MKRLATDPGTEALDAWMLRNSSGLETVTEMPETGEELVVSRLAALTPKQFTDLVLGGVRLATAAGMDTRACTGAGDILWPVLRECAEAVAEWQVGPGVSGDAEGDARLEQLQEHLVDASVTITELRTQLEGLRADLMAAHEQIEGLTAEILPSNVGDTPPVEAAAPKKPARRVSPVAQA
jgi:hypothetical protein